MKAQRAIICGNRIKLCPGSNFLALNAYIVEEERSQISQAVTLRNKEK